MPADAWSLIRRSQDTASEGDFEALFQAHYEGVYRLLYRIVGTREEAEDLAQETFLRLNSALARQSLPDGGLRPWLYRVATNLALNVLRAEGRRQQRQETVARLALAERSRPEDPAEAALRADERAIVRQALALLPERQAQLLLLRHAGLHYRELAEVLSLSPGSVGTLLARAEMAFEKAFRGIACTDNGE